MLSLISDMGDFIELQNTAECFYQFCP